MRDIDPPANSSLPAAALVRDVDHPCSLLCMACGRLADPAPTRPYRANHGTAAPLACPHCGQPELADLAPATTALALADALEYDRPARRPRAEQLVRRLVIAAVATLGLGSFALTLLMLAIFGNGRGWQVASALASLMLVLFGGPGLLLAARAIRREWRRTTRRRLPARWRLCLPQGGASRPAAPAPVVADSDLLTAPISGRSCVAFEVGLREDAVADAPAGTWLLLEQRSAPLRVGDAAIATDGACLELPRVPIAWPPPGPDRERAALFLRGRGFVISEAAALHVFESVLATGDLVAVLATTPPTLRVARA